MIELADIKLFMALLMAGGVSIFWFFLGWYARGRMVISVEEK